MHGWMQHSALACIVQHSLAQLDVKEHMISCGIFSGMFTAQVLDHIISTRAYVHAENLHELVMMWIERDYSTEYILTQLDRIHGNDAKPFTKWYACAEPNHQE